MQCFLILQFGLFLVVLSQHLEVAMADFADIASDIEQQRLQQSLTNRTQFTAHSHYDCDDCGEEIPAQRRAIGGVTRCVMCQTKFEAKQKHFR